MDSEFRQPSTRERQILEKLLEREFAGRDQLRAQLDAVTVKQILDDGTLSLRWASAPPAQTKQGLVAEATCKDADGGPITVLLHVYQRGFTGMLEILKLDGSPIMRPPSAPDLEFLPWGGGGATGKAPFPGR